MQKGFNTPEGLQNCLGQTFPPDDEAPRHYGPPIVHISPDGRRADLPEECIWDPINKAWWPKRYGPLPVRESLK